MNKLFVWLRNLRHWKTARAYRDLTGAMKKDESYATAWQANIAITILDNSKGKLTHAETNAIADKLMRSLFDVRAKGTTQ